MGTCSFIKEAISVGIDIIKGLSKQYCQEPFFPRECNAAMNTTTSQHGIMLHQRAIILRTRKTVKHTGCLHSHVPDETCLPFVTRARHLGVCLDDDLRLTMRHRFWCSMELWISLEVARLSLSIPPVSDAEKTASSRALLWTCF
ncbi:hypothetical protein AV530_009344 [Patagioenas fasciata monilis]|uniref:Uncharacterized protein n=1 Tax=Patagioenas fasciata monilis TaxID=372326 RepID=A0A1V4JIV4_PATFA|nr:hypothetical protein AV530_009344 [Patagioenas fasciata monilis]